MCARSFIFTLRLLRLCYSSVQPDLPRRLLEGIPLTPYDRSTFYTPETPKGYVDYMSRFTEDSGEVQQEL